MKKKIFSVCVILFCTAVSGYEIPDENEIITRTCRLAVKLEVIRDETLQKPTGRAIVTAHLFDDEGNPYRGERIEFSATAGTFACRLPEDSTPVETETDYQCFSTGDDGLAKPFLINIPYNQQVRVKATYTCGERIITTSASMSISRATVKKKKRVKP